MTSLRPSSRAGQGGLGKALIQEARVLLAERLLKCALHVMPQQAPEAASLERRDGIRGAAPRKFELLCVAAEFLSQSNGHCVHQVRPCSFKKTLE